VSARAPKLRIIAVEMLRGPDHIATVVAIEPTVPDHSPTEGRRKLDGSDPTARPATLRGVVHAKQVAAVVTTVVCGTAVSALLSVHNGQSSHRLAGELVVWAPTPVADPCPPHARIAGTPVDVRDGTGATVATSHLGDGRPDPTHSGCVYPFAVDRLPAADSYTFEVGAWPGLTYPRSAVAKLGWRVALQADG
jgi:hypothetical protein